MAGIFRPQSSFLQNTAWQNQALNALHYNTSQQGSVVPIVYGTMRQQVNLIDLGGYSGPTGKKGKAGSLPISGTSQTGKGGGGGKKGGGSSKKHAHYKIYVDFALCQGNVSGPGQIFSSSGVEPFSASGLNFHAGLDGQAADSYFNKVNYSGTCHITGTPLDLGQSPVLPNIAVEVSGILAGYHTGGYAQDANPADVVLDFLANARYGAAFPSSNIDHIWHDDTGTIVNTYGDYCQAANLLISTSLDGHMKAIEWLTGLCRLTNSALVWSGKLLKIVPYGDLNLSSNGATWNANWTAQYQLNDSHFLPWHPHEEGRAPTPGEEDPILVTRTSPADANNWMSIEYMDRNNFYNSTILTVFDQGAIDTYGLRIGDSLPGRMFANMYSAQIAAQLILQRSLYIRNTNIKFQLGWQFALLEPMDLVGLTGRLGDNYLTGYVVRITSIEENDNGDLTINAEDPQPGAAAPVTSPAPIGAVEDLGAALVWPEGVFRDPTTGAIVNDPGNGVNGWDQNKPPDSPTGTFSTWLKVDAANAPVGPSGVAGFLGTSSYVGTGYSRLNWLVLYYDYLGAVLAMMDNQVVFQSVNGAIRFDGTWMHVLITWDAPGVSVWVDGNSVPGVTVVGGTPGTWPSTIMYSAETGIHFLSAGGLLVYAAPVAGCVQDLWWDAPAKIDDPSVFRTPMNKPVPLGFRGEVPTGSPPKAFFHYYGDGYTGPDPIKPGFYGKFWFQINRAGYKPDDTGPGATWPTIQGDPAHPNCLWNGGGVNDCAGNPY